MTASSATVLANLAYLIGAVVLAVLGGIAVWWRHRKPTSVDANVASFKRGLMALAPEHDPEGRGSAGSRGRPRRYRPGPPSVTARPGVPDRAGASARVRVHQPGPASGEEAGEPSGGPPG